MLIAAVVVALLAALMVPGMGGVAGAAPPVPTGLSPNGGTFSANPPLTWNQVTQATKYRVYVCTSDPCSSSNDVWTIETVNTTATPDEDLPSGTLHWTVSAIDNSGTSNPATASFTKSQSGPVQQSPVDGTALQFPHEPPTFTWQAIPGARSYLLEIDDEDQFINPPESIVTQNPSFTLTETQALNKEFFWRVRSSTHTNPKSSSAILSDWSDTWSYSIEWPNPNPMLVSPPNTTAPGTAITDIELVWNPVPGAAEYQLQVNRNIDFSGQMVFDDEVVSTRYAPRTTWDNGSYHWRVRPIDENGNLGDWSEIFSFSRDWTSAPTLTHPPTQAPNSILDPLRFQWTPIDHAAYYEVQLSDEENFSPGTVSNCFTNHTLLTPYTMFSGPSGAPAGCSGAFWKFGHGQTVYWRVRGIDADANIISFFSPVSSFIRRMDIPTRTAPANGATVTTPVLTWNEMPTVQQYLVSVVDNEGDFVVKDVATWATTYTPDRELDPEDGPFKWYVRTRTDDGDGVIPNPGSWSSFDVPDDPATGPSPTWITPANNSSHVQMPAMTWTPVTGATEYEIWYSVVGSGVQFKLDTPKLRNAGFTQTIAPLPNGTYDIHVVAIGDGAPVAGPDRRITIADFPSAITQTGPADCPPGGGCAPVSSMPEMTWNHMPHGRFYLVYVAFDPNFTNVLKVYEVPQLSMIPREELPDNDAGQAYYWHVRPCKARNPYRCGPDPTGVANPPERAFQKRSAPVVLTAPASNAVVSDQPRFSWQPYLGTNPSFDAREYRIQVSTVPSFATLLDNEVVDQTYYTPHDVTYPEGPLYWRVRAIDGSNNELTWSNGVTGANGVITKDSGSPTLQTPTADQNVNGQPTFAWAPQPFSETYQIEVYKNGNDPLAPANRVVNQRTSHVQYTFDDPLPPQAPGVPYAWRVRRDDAQGKDGEWSDLRKFTITEAAPTLTAPAQNATVPSDQFVFSWTPVPRAARYRLQTSNNNFSSFQENQLTVMTSWAPDDPYPPGTWSWRVVALDAADNVIGTSNVRQFNRLNPAQSPTNITVTRSPGRLTIRWDPPAQMPTPGYTGYRVRLSPGPHVRSTNLNTRQVTFNGLVNGQVYDVKVMGLTGGTEGPPQQQVISGTPNGCTNTTFSDVQAAHLFCNEIRWMFTTGLSTGSIASDGTVRYMPAQPVSRGAMAAFMYRFAGSPPVNTTIQHFADVPASNPFFKEAEWMYQSGNSTGSPNPNGGKPLFKPNDAVDRQSMAAFVYRFAGNPQVVPSAPHFADVQVGHLFFAPIQWMFQSALSFGTPNPGGGKPFYQPTLAVSREAMAAFLYRYDQLIP